MPPVVSARALTTDAQGCAFLALPGAAEAVELAAVVRRQQHVLRRHDAEIGVKVHKHGGKHRRHKRADNELQAETLPGPDEQRYVDDEVHHADGDIRQVVDYHRNTGHAAGDYVVGVEEKAQSRGIEHRAEDYQEVLPEIILNCLRVMHSGYSSNSESCCSPLSSSRSRAPAAGRLRTR